MKTPIFIECKLITTQFFVFTYVHLELPIIEAFEKNLEVDDTMSTTENAEAEAGALQLFFHWPF